MAAVVFEVVAAFLAGAALVAVLLGRPVFRRLREAAS